MFFFFNINISQISLLFNIATFRELMLVLKKNSYFSRDIKTSNNDPFLPLNSAIRNAN